MLLLLGVFFGLIVETNVVSKKWNPSECHSIHFERRSRAACPVRCPWKRKHRFRGFWVEENVRDLGREMLWIISWVNIYPIFWKFWQVFRWREHDFLMNELFYCELVLSKFVLKPLLGGFQIFTHPVEKKIHPPSLYNSSPLKNGGFFRLSPFLLGFGVTFQEFSLLNFGRVPFMFSHCHAAECRQLSGVIGDSVVDI